MIMKMATPSHQLSTNRGNNENTAPFSDYSTSIPPEYLQQESDGSYDEGEYDYYVNWNISTQQ